MKKKNIVRLNFMVVPEELSRFCHVPSKVRCKIIEPDAKFLARILGESGRKMVKNGLEFYFTKTLADKLIAKKIAERVGKRRIL